MTHEMKLRHICFEKIMSGEKIYEIRLNDEKRKLISIGDVIIFRDENDLNREVEKCVEKLLHFDNFAKMLDELPLDKIGFKDFTKDEVEDVYHQFYSIENENKFGVVAIMLCD